MERTAGGNGTARAFGSANAGLVEDQSDATMEMQAGASPGDSTRVVTYARAGQPVAGPGLTIPCTARAFGSAVLGRWRVRGNVEKSHAFDGSRRAGGPSG